MKKYKKIDNNTLKNISGGKGPWNYKTGYNLGKWISKRF
ncbi:bacteriocin [Companilactobacillus nantensis]|nr:bacteriocin [Companilactobacillus nantensis]